VSAFCPDGCPGHDACVVGYPCVNYPDLKTTNSNPTEKGQSVMEAILVITLSIEKPEDVVDSIKQINPPSIPHFAGAILVSMDQVARNVVKYLSDEGELPNG
jgi:hypothetical protein